LTVLRTVSRCRRWRSSCKAGLLKRNRVQSLAGAYMAFLMKLVPVALATAAVVLMMIAASCGGGGG
jgi:hypothetical protein